MEHSASINMNTVIESLASALDLAEVATFTDGQKLVQFELPIPGLDVYQHNFSNHSKRTAVTAHYLGKQLGWEDFELSQLHLTALLHDIGAVDAYAKSHLEKNYMFNHVDSGYYIMKELFGDESLALAVKYHHENENGSGPFGLSGSEIPPKAMVIHLADTIELLYDDQQPYFCQRQMIVETIETLDGKLFSDEVLAAFSAIIEIPNYWLDLENAVTSRVVESRIGYRVDLDQTPEQLMRIAKVFAAIVDNKSAFTTRHSIGVAQIAVELGTAMGLSKEIVFKLQLAGLLHDLGKVIVSNSILDKPSQLTAREYDIVMGHSYYTRLLLGQIIGFEEVAKWAGNHHEHLTGLGYPQRIDVKSLSLECKIIAVADNFTALTEKRPYREPFSFDTAFLLMDEMVAAGKLDAQVLAVLKSLKDF